MARSATDVPHVGAAANDTSVAPSPDAGPATSCTMRLVPAAPGRRLDHAEEISLAAANGRAVLATTYQVHSSRSSGCTAQQREEDPTLCGWIDVDPGPEPDVRAWDLGADPSSDARPFEPSHARRLPGAAANTRPRTDYALAVLQGGRLATLTFGLRYLLRDECFVTLGDAQGARIARTSLAPSAASGEGAGGNQLGFGRLAAAWNSSRAIAVASVVAAESATPRPGVAARELRAYVFDGAGGDPRSIQLLPPRAEADAPMGVDVALNDEVGAVVYRSRSRTMLLPLTSAGGARGSPIVLSPTRTGAATIAFDGARAVVLWASRVDANSPYVLAMTTWDPATHAVTPTVPLNTGVASAFAPAIAIGPGHYAVTWMEGDSNRGLVRAGVSRHSLQNAVDHAITVSAPTANARDPEIACSGARCWVAWQQYEAQDGGVPAYGVVHVGSLECQ